MIRSMNTIGDLWPRCQTCGHIAQAHNADSCCEVVSGQCPTCQQHTDKAPCTCKGYVGPTWEQFKADYLTPEEIAHYWPTETTAMVDKVAQQIEMPLRAKSARDARRECSSRWPKNDVNLYGYDDDEECVYITLVRNVTKGNVATATKGRTATRFSARLV